MNWIVGEGSLAKIEKLSQGLRTKVLQGVGSANERGYVPWLGIRSISPLSEIAPPHQNLMIDPTSLGSLQKIMQASEEVDIKFSSMKGRINIDIGLKSDVVELYNKAIDLLMSSSGFYSRILANVVEIVIPLNIRSKLGSGVSFHSMHGAVFLGIPDGEEPTATLAINLAHEIGHQTLMLYQATDSLIVAEDIDLPCYSGVRKTFRPAIMTLHAAAALCHMIFACQSIAEKYPNATFTEFILRRRAQYQEDLSLTLQSLAKCCTFTDLGKFVLKDMLTMLSRSYQ